MPPLTAAGSRQDDPGPADLLWRHRFQKQHAQLLERMQALEKRDTVYDQRTRQAEKSSAACNATTVAFEQLCKRFEAIEEDEEQERQNELVSKILNEQGRELAVLRDKVRTYEGVHVKLRTSEEQVKELREALDQCSESMQELEKKIGRLEKKENVDILRQGDVRSSMARIKVLETRDSTKEKQLKNVVEKLSTLETEYRSKHAELQRSIESLTSGRKIQSVITPDISEGRASPSLEVERTCPKAPKATRPPLGPAPRQIHPAHATPLAGDLESNQQDAQLLPPINETRSNTQATTQVDEEERLPTSSTIEVDDRVPPAQLDRTDPAPNKKTKLNIMMPKQAKLSAGSGRSKRLQRSPQKIVVLRYTPSSDPITTAQDEPQHGRSTKESKQKQRPLVRPNPQKVGQHVHGPTQATPGQTTQFLRRSLRRKGNDASDTQHVELDRGGGLCVLPSKQGKVSGSFKPSNGQPKAVPKSSKTNSPPRVANAKHTKASAGQKAAAVSSKPIAPTSRTLAPVLKKRKRPKLDDLEWI